MFLRSRTLLVLLAAASGIASAGEPQLLDQVFERFVRPRALAGTGVLHLLYQRKADPLEDVYTCCRQLTPGKDWSDEERLKGGYVAAAWFEGTLYTFRGGGFSVYRGTEWRTLEWTLPWPVRAATRMGDQLWAFGAAEDAGQHRLQAARFVRDPAYAHLRPVAHARPLALPEAPDDLSVVTFGGSVMAFWHQGSPEAEANELWCASFDGERWGEPQAVALPYPNSDFAVAEHGGALWVFCKRRGHRMTRRHPLMALTLSGGSWSTPAAVPGAVDPWLNWTFDMDAASFDGALWVFRGCLHRMVVHRWRDGRWQPPEALFEESLWRAAVLWWWVGNGAASLGLLPFVAWAALRARRWPRQVVQTPGIPLRVASWARRVAALLVDFLVTWMLYKAAVLLLWPAESDIPTMEMVPSLASLLFAVCFVYFAASEGMSGQTLGKRVLGIAVVGPDGQRPSPARALLRNLVRPPLILAPVAYLVGSIVLLWTPRHQRVGDLLAGTFVVDVPRAPARPRPAEGE